ncbi:carbohydrate ABC transporter permease [Paludicola sp. MB14-C6]|uniref:carbohydrate ABC transporter permease n=1 Tax=Paludihabitans sp. MB14-C6 TaxID=3070656 RepID=UPI0027DB6590|nr:carbohydrate ABC transporter permease [Paludicola sp. MB14-C6]WMJ22720.1 carbohydrate ABC transporter permease [Paludicola sp. MB14-C6]
MKTTNKYVLISRIIILSLLAIFTLFPIIYTITNSFMSVNEINQYYNAESTSQMKIHLIPNRFSLNSYYQTLFRRPDYLVKFWNSLGLTSAIVFGQVAISTMAGYAFAKFKFPGRNSIFFIVIILMMMPYQVTLVSNYIVLKEIGLLNTYAAIILPSIFSPFGVFLLRQVIVTMPDEIIEAAKIDGANTFQILIKMVVPFSRSGIVALVILSFIDNWNMVEQPLVFLNNKYKYPLSIFLSQLNQSNPGIAFACGVLAMAPVALLFIFFEKELIEGISFSNLK